LDVRSQSILLRSFETNFFRAFFAQNITFSARFLGMNGRKRMVETNLLPHSQLLPLLVSHSHDAIAFAAADDFKVSQHNKPYRPSRCDRVLTFMTTLEGKLTLFVITLSKHQKSIEWTNG